MFSVSGFIRALRVIAVPALLLGACAPDSSPLGVLPATPVESMASGDGQTGRVGESLPVSPMVIVRDRFGNPVPDVEVQWQVAEGEGSVSPATGRTNDLGEATTDWTLGTKSGENAITASPGGLSASTITATALPGPPASVTKLSGDEQSQTVGASLADSLSVAVVDRYGNRITGATVSWAIESGGGTLEPTTSITDAAGEARANMVVGTTSGENAVAATVSALSTVPPARFTATGVPGPPADLSIAAGDAQSAPASSALPDSLAVQVTDQYGNLVPGATVAWAVTSGDGSVSPTSAETTDAGEARTRWVLGPSGGTNTATATISSLAPVTFTATAIATTFNMSVEGVHLNQGSQTRSGAIGGVSGRPGLLRVLLRANEPNSYSPPVLVRLYQGSTLMREELVSAPRSGVPVSADLEALDQTWNIHLPASEVAAGLSVEVLVDPMGTVPETSRSDNRYPAVSGTVSLDVLPLNPFRIVFIPIHATVHDRTGSITPANAETFLAATRQWIPTGSVLTSFRSTYTTDLDLSVGSNWSTLLSEIHAVSVAEGARDEYYHGIIGDFPDIAWGGMAYVPFSAGSGYRSGISYDRLPYASATIAHELGHNLGRWHAPCGNPAGVDSGYPYVGATLGSPGYDISGRALRAASSYRDFMSYCSPEWTSDYTFSALLQWRRNDPLGVPAAASRGDSSERADGLLVWGTVGAGGVTLNPSFAMTSVPRLPESAGPNQLRALADDGREIFSISFAAAAIADGGNPDERHFAYFVPTAASDRDRISTLELVTPVGSTVRHSAAFQGGAPVARPDARVERLAGDRLRVRWNADAYPMALVR
ncbi:MAG: Ig-like domain-containing protein, partial [Gemmatimonadota bacterium]